MSNTDTTSELRQQLAAILIKWDMPTRQAALDDIMQLIAAQKQRWAIQMLDRLTIQATETKDVKTGAIRQTVGLGFILNERRALAALDGVIGSKK